MNKALRKFGKRNLAFLKWKLSPGNKKIFCIGRNKTGTTSLTSYLEQKRFYFNDQKTAELLVKDYADGDWSKILAHCKTAQIFQDAPFSWPNTWKQIVKQYPNAKYILTYRAPESWYSSLTRFHTKLFSSDSNRTPDKSDLMNAEYRYKGFMWDANRAVWNTPEDDVYNKEIMLANYNQHNSEVRAFFKDKPNFLEIDISSKEDFKKLNDFLNIKSEFDRFPHLNKS
ncbi:hypothetical protein GYB22_01490 [bacterium]|nr:hypothetical protein [bacterium]